MRSNFVVSVSEDDRIVATRITKVLDAEKDYDPDPVIFRAHGFLTYAMLLGTLH